MNKKICFVIMGFGKKKDPETNRTIDLDQTSLLSTKNVDG